MISKIAIIIFAETNTVETMGRVSNAFMLAGESAENGDDLIIAAGARNHYFGNDDWQEQAPGLKSLEDASAIRSRILEAFEKAEVETDTKKKKAADRVFFRPIPKNYPNRPVKACSI